jgi:ankyrin repeat protein
MKLNLLMLQIFNIKKNLKNKFVILFDYNMYILIMKRLFSHAFEGSIQPIKFVFIDHTNENTNTYNYLANLIKKTFYESQDKQNIKQCYDEFIIIYNLNCQMYPNFIPSPEKLTLLYMATVYNQYLILDFLLKMNASTEILYKKHFSPLHVAARSGYSKCLDLLLKYKANIHAETDIGNCAIHIAATYGHLDCIKLLIQYGENINNNFTRNGVTPLQCSLTYDQDHVVSWLLENGANPYFGRFLIDNALEYFVNNNNDTYISNEILPIHVACRFGSIKSIKILLDMYPDLIDFVDEKERTPLHTACLFNQFNIVKYLLDNTSIDIKKKDKQSAEPLHIAFSFDNKNIFNLLSRKSNLEYKHLTHIHNHAIIQGKYNIAEYIQLNLRSE